MHIDVGGCVSAIAEFILRTKHAGSGLLVSEHRQFAFAERHCLTAMCNQPKHLLRILHIFVAYLMIGDWRYCRFQI